MKMPKKTGSKGSTSNSTAAKVQSVAKGVKSAKKVVTKPASNMSINPTSIVLGTGLIVVAGQIAVEKKLNAKSVLGFFVMTLFIAFMNEINGPIAMGFSLLIFVTALFKYGIPLFKKMGFA